MMVANRSIVALVLTIFLACPATGQDWKTLGVDEIFEQARQKAFNGQREEAREMLKFALERSPNYYDLRILLGRTYAWDGQRENARKELTQVLTAEPSYLDAISAAVDVEMWDEKYADALTVVDAGLSFHPNATDLLLKKTNILDNLGRQNEATLILQQILAIDPAHEKALEQLDSRKLATMRYTVGADVTLDFFSRTFDPAQYSSLYLSRTNKWGSAMARLNYSHRFSSSGIQGEVDLYPRIADGVYAYLNYGYSTSDLFPLHRAGAEVFSKLPRSFEASAGMRYLYFGTDSKIAIYTGSIGWYVKSYWLSLRPYITPDKETGTSYSASLTVRKYFTDGNHFLGLSAGAGFSPDDRRIQSGVGLSTENIYILKSQRAGIAFRKSFAKTWMVDLGLNIVRQELSFDQGEYVLIYSFNAGLRKRF
jgi:YaiO family outer membrane protein